MVKEKCTVLPIRLQLDCECLVLWEESHPVLDSSCWNSGLQKALDPKTIKPLEGHGPQPAELRSRDITMWQSSLGVTLRDESAKSKDRPYMTISYASAVGFRIG